MHIVKGKEGKAGFNLVAPYGLPALLALTLVAALGSYAAEINDSIKPPPAKFDVEVDRGVMIPMRDGVHLSTDVYRPKGLSGPLPVILLRTPYDKLTFYSGPSRAHNGGASPTAYVFAGQGYVVATQDLRGKFESEGEFFASADDVNDGYDTIEWLAKQPWSNGKIGMIGCSFLRDTQVFAIKTGPPNLAGTGPQAAGSPGVS